MPGDRAVSTATVWSAPSLTAKLAALEVLFATRTPMTVEAPFA
ncbi:hypothetical protein [Pyxidicoccus sp. MSG2]|nr:hypothetical protein [Pyxidicoccus sp. MSG2]MCY1022300.1 hypothetical protein [Pyxidicoccus sp. MSG2]